MTPHLGMRPGELDGKRYAKYWQPVMAPLSAVAREALAVGPVAAALLPALTDLPRLFEGEQPLENGFGLAGDGSLHVAIRTAMPDVTPDMIDWWFAWHSDEPQRYKLWHPRAHVDARWQDPRGTGYRGRVSLVREYLGSTQSHVAIEFLEPAALGCQPPGDDTLVCARIRFAATPLEAGVLAHHVRRVPGGSEMRSRFWLGGRHAALRGAGWLGGLATRALVRVVKPSLDNGRDLLVHCAQEMAHLASFLPALHAER